MKNIGESISSLRKQKGMTQEELGRKVDLSRVTIVKIENSQRAISLEEAIKIADALETDIDKLYEKIEDETVEEDTFITAFKAKGIKIENLNDVKRIELLVDALFAQEQIGGI